MGCGKKKSGREKGTVRKRKKEGPAVGYLPCMR